MSAPSPSPKARPIEFVPEYAEQDGVKHEFTGLLYIPAPGESERCEAERKPEINPVCIAVEDSKLTVAVHRARIHQRMKMSAGALIRLGATKNRSGS